MASIIFMGEGRFRKFTYRATAGPRSLKGPAPRAYGRKLKSGLSIRSKAAGETGAAANQVLTASQETARQAEGLCGEVDRFLQEVRTA